MLQPHAFVKILLAAGSLWASMLCPLQSRAQQRGFWLPVDTVTTGPYEDHNPVMKSGGFGYGGGLSSWLVFERWTPTESQIGAMQYHPASGTWDSSVVILATRGLPDLQMKPDYAQLSYYSEMTNRVRNVAAWQCLKHGRWQILYCSLEGSDSVWSGPRLLASDSLDNTAVRVVPVRDSLFLFAWKRGQAIMGLFQGPTTSTTPETLAVSSADSVAYDLQGGFLYNRAGLVWTAKSSGLDAFLYRTVGRDSQTVVSDSETLLVRQQCSNPRFCLDYNPKTIVFESLAGGSQDVYTNGPSYFSSLTNLSNDPLSEDRNPRGYKIPMVTKRDAVSFGGAAGFDVCLYEKYRGPDSALVFLAPLSFENDTVRSRGYNRNATISSETGYFQGYTRVPVVWESNRTGTSHIYARFVPLVFDDIGPGSSRPTELALYQNFPNPFNPQTTIGYLLPAASQVLLVVYDLLGREVRTLVHERQDAGKHQVVLDGGGLASGVYFYRLHAHPLSPAEGGPGDRVQTKSLILLR